MKFKITYCFSDSFFILMLGFLSLTSVSQASTYTYNDFNFPYNPDYQSNYSGSRAIDINDRGHVLGFYLDGAIHIGERYFVYNGRTYTELNNPLAVGYLDIPNTFASSINNSGQIVGSYRECIPGCPHPFADRSRGFVYNEGTYTPIQDPYISYDYSDYSSANGINNKGQITGSYHDSTGNHGFLYHEGIFTTLNHPNAPDATSLGAINDKGQILGFYTDSAGSHQFLYDGGSYMTLNDPYGSNGYFVDINNSGQMVGNYRDSTGFHGFLYDGGSYMTLDNPNAPTNSTHVSGINNKGQVVGWYRVEPNSYGIESNGFIATPAVPVPAAVWLFGSALAGLIGLNWRKQAIIA